LLALRRRELAEGLATLTRAEAALADAERALHRTRAASQALAEGTGRGAPGGPMPAGWLACGSALHACETEQVARLAVEEHVRLREVAAAREARDCARENMARAVRAMRAVENRIAASRRS
jgi:hypothetical protein